MYVEVSERERTWCNSIVKYDIAVIIMVINCRIYLWAIRMRETKHNYPAVVGHKSR